MNLSEEKQKELQGKSEEISQRTLDTLRKIRDLEKALKKRLANWKRKFAVPLLPPTCRMLKKSMEPLRSSASGSMPWPKILSALHMIFVAAAKTNQRK